MGQRILMSCRSSRAKVSTYASSAGALRPALARTDILRDVLVVAALTCLSK
jgi:hypothetical protein